jgi:putative DNA methylase
MPLIKSFALSTKAGKEYSIDPIIDRKQKTVRFRSRQGQPSHEGTVQRSGARCLVCGESAPLTYVRSEGKAKRIGEQMLAVVAEGDRGRAYMSPDEEQERIARSATLAWAPDTELVENPRHMSPPLYGMTKHRDLFTVRQLAALTTFSDLVGETRERVLADAVAIGFAEDGKSLESGGTGADAYADAVATYLGFVVGKVADYNSSLCRWDPGRDTVTHTFARQTISMVWDYAEANPLSESTGSFFGSVTRLKEAISNPLPIAESTVFARDAADENSEPSVSLIATDPPYYDNVPYADLSDFFYVWLRSSLRNQYPDLFATILVPKARELVADATRFGGDRNRARDFFETGLGQAFASMRRSASGQYPTTVFYAFKQSESEETEGESLAAHSSVGWEAMLAGLIASGLEITATWPMRSERATRTRGHDSNALASSIVLACRPRHEVALRCTRSDFLQKLREELPEAVKRLRDASLAATDLEQAAIGPGMAIFSRYGAVLEADDSPMTVRSALAAINEELAQIILGEIADVDPETHFALAWFDQHGYAGSKYDDVLVRAKNAHVGLLSDAGVLVSGKGRLALLRPIAVDRDGHVSLLRTYPAWAQMMHVMAALLGKDGGEERAAEALKAAGPDASTRIKDIAYHCYLTCERTKRSTEGRDFNALVTVWPDLERQAAELPSDRLL